MIRSAFNFDPDSFSRLNSVINTEDSLAQQSFKEECDINVILRRFAVTGQLPDNVRVPQYAEFEEAFDFMSCMNVIRAGEEAFAAMPSDVRERFANDPARFIAFANNKDNYDEALKMGLVVSRPAPPAPAPTPSPTPDAGASGTSST